MKLSTVLGIAVLIVLCGTACTAIYWLDGIVGSHLSDDGRLALPEGRFIFILLPGLIDALRHSPREPDRPARIDPSGNRVLQSVWRDPKPLLSPRLKDLSLAVLVVAALGLYGWSAFDALSSSGDRSVGFLAGIGVWALVTVAYVGVGLAVLGCWRLAKPLIWRPTPVPAP